MSQLKLDAKNLIKPEEAVIKQLLISGEYIICCDMPSGIDSIVIENVICIKDKIKDRMDSQCLAMFTVANNPDSNLYSLHDDMVFVIGEDSLLDDFITKMINTYDIFVREEGNVDRTEIFGKLGTEYEDEVIYRYI